MTSPQRHSRPSLDEVAQRLAPDLRIISVSQPAPLLRGHNVLFVARDVDTGRRAVLALESLEHADDQLGTVVMGAVSGDGDAPTAADADDPDKSGSVDPEGVGRQIVPRVLAGGGLGALLGALVVGGAALVFGAAGWQLVGAAVAGAMLMAVFGAMWWTFAGLGGSDAYRQTFVEEQAALTVVSIHTDDPAEAAAARERLSSDPGLRILDVDRLGQISTPTDEPWTDEPHQEKEVG